MPIILGRTQTSILECICRIFGDDNVQLGKPFDMMDYPNRTHALSEGQGTQFHVYSTLTRYIEEHVPPGGMPR